jgi:hypothetical protein
MRRALALAILPLALAACGETTAPDLPRAGPPRELALSFGGYGYGSHTVTLRGDTLVVVRRDFFPPQSATTTSVVPDAAAWRRFWQAAGAAGVERWPRVCENRDVADGGGFTLRLIADAGTWESQGSNSYPQANGRCSGSPDFSRDFRTFTEAVSALIGRPFP